MSDEQSPTSVRARKRALGKILRDVSIMRRETYFDLLVSGYSVQQIASSTKKSPATVRRVVSVRPWRSGGSIRRRTMPGSRSRG
jgi:transposase